MRAAADRPRARTHRLPPEAARLYCRRRRQGAWPTGSIWAGRSMRRASRASALLLDPSDLLTHGLIVGMTGSGKTGLAVVLIEEVLRQGTGVIAIDPKGDLANLLLLFDDLAPASFEPWIDPETAAARRRAGARRPPRRRSARARASPSGASAPRTSPRCAAPTTRSSSRRARTPACRSTSCSRSTRRPSRSTRPRRTCATRSSRSWRACSASCASTPTRCSRRRPSSSRRSSSARGARARGSRSSR